MAEPEDETTPFDAAESDNGNGDGTGFLEAEAGELPEIMDLSAVKPTTYELIPRGVYEAFIDQIEYGLSDSKNLPMLTWHLKFDYGEDEDGNPVERTLRYYTTLAGDGLGRTVALLQQLDPELDLSQFRPEEMDEHFGGWQVRIRVTTRRDRQDRKLMRNNIAAIMPLEEDEFSDET